MDALHLYRFLLDPASYPDDPATVTAAETHVSRLFFTPDRVYKIKKPVDFGFLNFTTLARRRYYCQAELRLNRRFAPDTYERVATIREQRGRLSFDGPGRAVEYAVVMKRLPHERLLSTLLDRNAPCLAAEIDRLGRHLAALHRAAPVVRGGRPSATALLRRNWRENLAQMHPLTGPTLLPPALALVGNWIDTCLARHASLLRQREADGWVRDGHGDLHAEHICLSEPIRIYDCIEFNRRFRVGDILADLAFLLMDLDFRGQPHLAEGLLHSWQRELAAAGPDALALLRCYRLYRAFVRGKVDTFLALDDSAPAATRQDAAALARRYFNLALGYLAPPVLVVTCGLMGVGKSSLARHLADALRARLLRSDAIRKELAGIPAGAAVDAPFAAGLYSPAWNERTYAALLDRTAAALGNGESAVVDAACGRRADRARFAELAQRHARPLLLLHLQARPELLLARLARRRGTGDLSDGRPELLPRQAAGFEPPDETEECVKVDAEESLDYNVQAVLIQLLTRHGATAA